MRGRRGGSAMGRRHRLQHAAHAAPLAGLWLLTIVAALSVVLPVQGAFVNPLSLCTNVPEECAAHKEAMTGLIVAAEDFRGRGQPITAQHPDPNSCKRNCAVAKVSC